MTLSKTLVITGDGINCERETARAFEQEGGTVKIQHVNEFLKNPEILLQHQIFALPGGFSFGDELRSGKILAEKMRNLLSDIFRNYTAKGGLTIGVCNGFQVLIQLGAFGDLHADAGRDATLATNSHGRFWDQWVEVDITPQAKGSPWFEEMSGTLLLPIRHKEGRIVPRAGNHELRIPLRYKKDVNGSYSEAAALLDPTGRVLGVMPHPEAATQAFLNPSVGKNLGISAEENANAVRKLFKNALKNTK